MDRLPNLSQKLKNYRIKRTFKETIEPEEILMDASKIPELEDQKLELPIKPRIFKTFFGLVLLAGFILAGQAFFLQIIKGDQYQNLAERNRIRRIPDFASRGIIYDRSGRQLVFNVPSFDLVLTVQDLPEGLAEQQIIVSEAAQVLGVSAEEIRQKIKSADPKDYSSISIAENLEHEKVLLIESKLDQLKGFRIEQNITRQYVNGPAFSHIMGYLGKLSPKEAAENPDYFLTEKIGKAGLELFYEKYLRGKPGEKLYEVDSTGKVKGELAENKSKDGQGLILAVDARLQDLLYENLKKVLDGASLKRGAAVAIDPSTGGILALVSLPGFDNNLFAQGISGQDYKKLNDDPAQPFLNRAISGQYPPGSTIKPMIGAAALQEKVISATTKINDKNGELILTSQYGQAIWRFGDWKTHGLVDMRSAIAQSCDVYFYTIGGGYGDIKGLGVEKIEEYLKKFHFGSALSIDLAGESAGLVPDPEWKEKAKNEQWYIGDTYHVSIGQGDLLVTPLQLAAATASVLNGGKIMAPRLVDKIVDSDKNIITNLQPRILGENSIEENNLQVIKEGMRQTVTSGSALLLNGLSVETGAKTGTAQVAGQDNSNAWAAVFAPFQDPSLVIVVLAENGGEGSAVAIPVVKKTLEEYFK